MPVTSQPFSSTVSSDTFLPRANRLAKKEEDGSPVSLISREARVRFEGKGSHFTYKSEIEELVMLKKRRRLI